MNPITSVAHKLVQHTILLLIFMGVLTSPDQIKGEVDAIEYKYMCGATEIENGNTTGITEEEHRNDIYRILLTCSVIKNRIDSPNWYGDTVEKVIMAKGQYASVTRNGFKTKEASDLVKLCCKYVLIYGAICPADIVYQGQNVNGRGKMINGKLVHEYARIPVRGDKDEIFCYE